MGKWKPVPEKTTTNNYSNIFSSHLGHYHHVHMHVSMHHGWAAPKCDGISVPISRPERTTPQGRPCILARMARLHHHMCVRSARPPSRLPGFQILRGRTSPNPLLTRPLRSPRLGRRRRDGGWGSASSCSLRHRVAHGAAAAEWPSGAG